MRANQLRLWFASMAYVLLCALRGNVPIAVEISKPGVYRVASLRSDGNWLKGGLTCVLGLMRSECGS